MTRPPNGTLGPPPTTSTPLDSGRLVTELSGTSIDLGNVVIEDPATGLPIPTQNGGLQTYVVGPNPLPVSLPAPSAENLYLAAGTLAGILAAGGSQALAAAGTAFHLSVAQFSIIPNAALTGTPSLWVELRSGATVLVSGIVTFMAPLVVPFGASVPMPGTSLAIFYGPNSGSLDLHYTIAGVTP